jgi:hypothetical protein
MLIPDDSWYRKRHVPIVFVIFFTTEGIANNQSHLRAKSEVYDILLSRMHKIAHNFA